MPEGPEVESEHLHEAIEKELEKTGGRFLKMIAVTTALFAALAAVSALRAGATVNEALLLKTEGTQYQAQASDQWAYFQAKGVKAAIQDASASAWTAAGKPAPPELSANAKRYADEQAEISAKARELEHKRDERSSEADHLLHLHHGYANAVALLQVSIALSAIAALTRRRWIWVASLVVGLSGAALFSMTWLG